MSGHSYDPRRLGADGEAAVARWYEARGYTVLARNWRCAEGELDLVLSSGRLVVVCEVKTRSSLRYGSPFEAVGPAKRRRLRRLGGLWVATEAPFRPTAIRYDVASVVSRRIEVLHDAL